MNEIVNASGLSKGAFYHYFQSKERLFAEVIDTFFFGQMMVDYSKLSQNSLQDFYREYAQQFKKTVLAFNEYLKHGDTKVDMNYLTLMFDAMNLFPDFRSKLREAELKELGAWTSVVRASRTRGEFSSPMSDEQIARMFIYSNHGVGLYLLFNGDLTTVDHELLTLWDNFYLEIKN